MRKIALLIALLLAAIVSGCKSDGTPEPDLGIGAFETSLAPTYPAECFTKTDPRWVPMPDADVRLSEASRRELTNRQSFRTIAARRSVCAAYLTALGSGSARP